jgi:hypothetical protein
MWNVAPSLENLAGLFSPLLDTYATHLKCFRMTSVGHSALYDRDAIKALRVMLRRSTLCRLWVTSWFLT